MKPTRETSAGTLERDVRARYENAARAIEPALCCPIDYDPQYLQAIPQEIIDKDYGCGDPSKYVEPGETVLDLGSGAGKICYIAAQKVGAEGRVIGVDFNPEMLALARKYQPEMAEKIGTDNVTFRRGRIQDLTLDLEKVEEHLQANPVSAVTDLDHLDHLCQQLRDESPLVESDSVDVVVSNCVLNLVHTGEKAQLFNEIFRVLNKGGRAVISDIVCDEEPTDAMKADPELWSGCVSGAFVERDFLRRFEEAGFHGIEILDRQQEPWQVIDGIEFRSLTVRAYKGKQGPCIERRQAVIYKGPWRSVTDDDGHTYERGQRMAVCDKTFHLLTGAGSPYRDQLIPVEPLQEVPLESAGEFDCSRDTVRDPRETKGEDYHDTRPGDASACCGPGSDCC